MGAGIGSAFRRPGPSVVPIGPVARGVVWQTVADSTSVASSSVYSLPWKLIAMNRKLGRDGPQLFPIGLGCMGMSEGYGERAERDEQESIATIHRALDIGANFLDTADIYGPH